MLQIKQISKQYKTGNLVQKALDNVSLNLRENEFVAILGPSGSGKTTLLNIIGGLDRYDTGDLIINSISTKKYKDRDWDSYRNHTIGFVFQSYNLIPHQTVLANVELALTISGISKGERKKRARAALEKVGLGEQSHKKPNQMSGGQMQRVAIARALVNDPDILLADEPTGALDSETSVQVMELLKEVAKDRLVVMVTHNPELAQEYATRIVNLKDGVIRSDSDPFEVDETHLEAPVHKNMGKSSMSFLTALSLSFNNLRTKKARTLLTSFAGSIGIIGIALILSISNGVNTYIQSVEEDTLSEYPLQIQSTGMNISSMMSGLAGSQDQEEGQVGVMQMLTSLFSQVDSNDLESLKAYFESGESGIEQYTNAIEYSYDVSPQIYQMVDDSVRQVHPDNTFASMGLGSGASSSSMMSSMMSTNVFFEMPQDADLYEDQYDVKAGRWPENYNECVLVLSSDGRISDFLPYILGFRDFSELDDMVEAFVNEENVEAPDGSQSYAYEDFIGITFKLVNAADYYAYDDRYDVWTDKTEDTDYMEQLVSEGEDLTIVGVVQPQAGTTAAMLSTGICYPASLTQHVMEQAAQSPIVQQQISEPGVNVFTGNKFGEENTENSFSLESLFTINEDAVQDAFQFDESALDTDMSQYFNFSAGSLDLSGMMDFSNLSLDLPELEGLNIADIMNQLDIQISTEYIDDLVKALMDGYQQYAANNPQADYSKLNESFQAYLQTPEAQTNISSQLEAIIDSSNITVPADQLNSLITQIASGFQAYLESNGLTEVTDPAQIQQYLMAYLQTPEVQQMIADGAAQIIISGSNINVSPEQLNALADSIITGYEQYAAANGLPDPSQMDQHFNAYLQTPEAQQQLMNGIGQIINADSLQSQLSGILQTYMEQIMGTYSSALSQALQSQITALMQQIMTQLGQTMTSGMEQAMSQIGANMENAFSFDADAFANAIEVNMTEEELTELLTSMMSGQNTSYDSNLRTLGYADPDDPSSINIYPLDFESKGYVVDILDSYNDRMRDLGQEEKVISYTDMVGTLMSSVTDIIDVISYVLVAFVAISLVVSSIMIGVITYISVLERRKEIGILRAIGASKRNVSQVFNAETFIVGLCAGLIGIGLTLLLLIPTNQIIRSVAGEGIDIRAALPPAAGIALILISIFLTLIGGLIPSKKAAKSDPVTALRTE